ncbi:hypothetical protein VTJ49DRAFT_7306 [Mycothermus thermophilus]|uniref:Rhodopsin domain-containing protein n=1 Tax=Humicola insolens TaxID=85995 RepID=A0ABR3VH99_HUMIN
MRGPARPLGRRLDEQQELPPDVNLGPYLNRVIWSLAGLATLFLGLRVYCKLLRKRALWWDDYFLIASWIALIVSIALQTVATTHGLGRLYAYLDDDSISTIAVYSISAGFGSILATCWSKTSFAISLLRIAPHGGGVRMLVWFIIISVNIVLASNGLVQWIQCWPVSKLWHWEMEGSCYPPEVVQKYNTFVAAFSGGMDIVLAILPWKIILTVAINKKEKLGAVIAMSVGVISHHPSHRPLFPTTVHLFIFGTAEPATCIMAASIPVLRTLIPRKTKDPQTVSFIELPEKRKKGALSVALASPASDAAFLDPKQSRKMSTEEQWARISYLEEARVRGSGDERGGSGA